MRCSSWPTPVTIDAAVTPEASASATAIDAAGLPEAIDQIALARLYGAPLFALPVPLAEDLEALVERVESAFARPEAELEGATPDGVLDGILSSVPVPR